jgi:hypothetical protein
MDNITHDGNYTHTAHIKTFGRQKCPSDHKTPKYKTILHNNIEAQNKQTKFPKPKYKNPTRNFGIERTLCPREGQSGK